MPIIYRPNLQATKLFCNIGYQDRLYRFDVWFKISYRVIQRLIQHIFLSKMVYLDLKYTPAIRNYEFLITGISSQCGWHTLSPYYLELHYYTHFRTSQNNNSLS